MSWTTRARDLMDLGLSESDATAFVRAEREAAERGEAGPQWPERASCDTADHLPAHICEDEPTCIDCDRPSDTRLCDCCFRVVKL